MSFQHNSLSNSRNEKVGGNSTLPQTSKGFKKYGALCTDSSGLSLGSKGNIDSSKSGVYATILRLASQLDGCGSIQTSSSSTNKPPFVSIETDISNVVIKEYGSHTVVVRIPTEGADNRDNNAESKAQTLEQGHTGLLDGDDHAQSRLSPGTNLGSSMNVE